MAKRKLQALEELDEFCVNDEPKVRKRVRDACNICLRNLKHKEMIEYDDLKKVFQADLDPNDDRRKRARHEEPENDVAQPRPTTDIVVRERLIQQNPTTNSPYREPSIQRSPTTSSSSRETSIQPSPTTAAGERSTGTPTTRSLAIERSTGRRPRLTAAGRRPRLTAAGEQPVPERRRNPGRPGRPEPNQFRFGYIIRSSKLVRRGGGGRGGERRGGERRGGRRHGGGRRVRGRGVRGRRRGEEYYVSEDVIEQEVTIELEGDSDSDMEEDEEDDDSDIRDTRLEDDEDATPFLEQEDANFRENDTGPEEVEDANFKYLEDATDFRATGSGFEYTDDASGIGGRASTTEFEEDGTGKRTTTPEKGKSSQEADIEHVRLDFDNLNVNIDFDISNCLSNFEKLGGLCLLLFDTLRTLPENTCKLVVTQNSMVEGLLKAFGIKFDDDFELFMMAVAIDLKTLIKDIMVDVSSDKAAIGLSCPCGSEADVNVVRRYFSNRQSELLSQRDLLFDTGMLVSSLGEERDSSKFRNGKQTKSDGKTSRVKSLNIALENLLNNVEPDSREVISKVVSRMCRRQLQPFTLSENVMGHKQALFISKEDATHLFKMKRLRISCIQFFIGYLHSICDNDRYGWVCPQHSSLVGHDMLESARYISGWMSKGQKQMYFVPYHHDNHWMLAILDITKHQVYWFDPMGFPESREFKTLLDVSIRLYCTEGHTVFTPSSEAWPWIKVDCARQPGSTECGYYILRYMLEIVTNYNSARSLTELFQDTSPYSQDEIDKVRDLWAIYFKQVANMMY